MLSELYNTIERPSLPRLPQSSFVFVYKVGQCIKLASGGSKSLGGSGVCTVLAICVCVCVCVCVRACVRTCVCVCV